MGFFRDFQKKSYFLLDFFDEKSRFLVISVNTLKLHTELKNLFENTRFLEKPYQSFVIARQYISFTDSEYSYNKHKPLQG